MRITQCTPQWWQSSVGENKYCNLHFQTVVKPSQRTPSRKMAGPISQALGAYEGWSNERRFLMVIDRAHEDRLLPLLCSGALHSAST